MNHPSIPKSTPDVASAPLWEPTSTRQSSSIMSAFTQFASVRTGRSFSTYQKLHHWSVTHTPRFWELAAEFLKLRWINTPRSNEIFKKSSAGLMRGSTWFGGATLNFAQNLLASQHGMDGSETAFVALAEGSKRREYSRDQLRQKVAAISLALKDAGVVKGDRVAGVLINGPEALMCMLATASIGAVWSSCSPDFGVAAVVDRLSQVNPKIVFYTRSYVYGGKNIDCTDAIAAVRAKLEGIEALVTVRHLDDDRLPQSGPNSNSLPHCIDFDLWADFPSSGLSDEVHATDSRQIRYEPMDFGDPLYIMFSSGTTGVPKCIVHSVGGTLLQHMKELMLHSNIGPGSRLLYFTTCGWMMWNWMVSALATGASLVIYDGSPAYPDTGAMWKVVAENSVTHFGTSPKYISTCIAAGLRPGKDHDLENLESVLSTGSPLLPEHFKWVYSEVKKDIHLASISGGTDIISCFMLGNPNLPVFAGEIQCVGLGMAVAAWDDLGNSLREAKGELVCTAPFVSMPTMFWNDPFAKKYSAAYFDHFHLNSESAGKTGYREVWRHGDFIEITERGGVIVYGRSDATLNPGGVRIGTAELYRQVETMPEILDSVAIGQCQGEDTRIVLFVKVASQCAFNDELVQNIRKRIRAGLSPRHVPAVILEVADIPYTRSGKKMELAVTQAIHGEPIHNIAAIANPESMDEFVRLRSKLVM